MLSLYMVSFRMTIKLDHLWNHKEETHQVSKQIAKLPQKSQQPLAEKDLQWLKKNQQKDLEAGHQKNGQFWWTQLLHLNQ